MAQPLQSDGSDTVATWRGIIIALPGAMNQHFMAVSGEIKTTLLSFKFLQQGFSQILSEGHINRSIFSLHQLQQGIKQKSIVIQISIQMCYITLASSEQTVIHPKFFMDKIDGLLCCGYPIRALQHATCTR